VVFSLSLWPAGSFTPPLTTTKKAAHGPYGLRLTASRLEADGRSHSIIQDGGKRVVFRGARKPKNGAQNRTNPISSKRTKMSSTWPSRVVPDHSTTQACSDLRTEF
jgi:hypothetical protein